MADAIRNDDGLKLIIDTFQNQMPNWMNTANNHLMVQAHAVRNIERLMKESPESRNRHRK